LTAEHSQLHVYSAGAVAAPLQEAVKIFEREEGARVRVTVGKPANLLASIAQSKQGDLISCGAEYILDEAESRGLIVKGSRRSLGARRSVIIVPVGNPGGIRSLADLCRPDARIGVAADGCLKGVWDDIASKAGVTDAFRRNITHYADACGSLMALINQEKVDAIIGWNAFHNIWPDSCEVIELEDRLQTFRSTVIGIVKYTSNMNLAQKLVDFLVSDKGRGIYADYGWINRECKL